MHREENIYKINIWADCLYIFNDSIFVTRSPLIPSRHNTAIPGPGKHSFHSSLNSAANKMNVK